jgi:hypothetical protein
MSSRRSFSVFRLLTILVTASSAGGLALAVDGCGSDTGDVDGGPTSDAPSPKESGNGGNDDGGTGKDSSTTLPDGSKADSSCPPGKVVPDKGETCVGFGKGTPCGTTCGLPPYGYVCLNGGPPGFAGCVQASSTSFGETYCCPENKCVPQPDQDTQCKTAGKGHRYQCPPDGNGGSVAPPANCVDGGSGGSAVERFYCCP